MEIQNGQSVVCLNEDIAIVAVALSQVSKLETPSLEVASTGFIIFFFL